MFERNIAIFDLSKREVKIKPFPKSLRKKFLGGRGVNVFLLYKMTEKMIEPFSEKNVLIFGAGFLTGTLAPSSSRFNVTSKSPETYFLGDASCGGFFGAEMRYAGFDHLIFKGKSKNPVVVYIKDGRVEFFDGENLWGKNTLETQKALKKEFGDEVQVVCIGRAGENLVRFASVRHGLKNTAARGGMGAVMGYKNLKAIVVSGSLGLRLKYPEEFLRKAEELKKHVESSKVIEILGRIGTPFLYKYSNVLGCIRTKNSQLNAFSDSLDGENFGHYSKKMVSCFGCFVHCRHRNKFGGEGPEYSAVGLLGANLGISNFEEVIKLNNLCNDLGLDVSSTGSYVSWVIELLERGILDESWGVEIEWGSYRAIKELIENIAYRKGFGNIVAEGSQAVKKFGKESKKYLIAVKNLPQSDPHDCRYIKAFALGIATASRGADHLRSRPTLEIFTKLPQELREDIYGGWVSPDPTSYDGKELTVYFSENIFAVIDSLGLCKFLCHGFNSPHLLGYHHFRDLIYLSSGLEFSDLEEVGKRIVDVERLYNLREGLRREHDTLPERYFSEEMKLKIAKGEKIDRKEFSKMVSRYYKLRGWDEKGFLKRERVEELVS